MSVSTHAMSVKDVSIMLMSLRETKIAYMVRTGSPNRCIAITIVVGHVWELNCQQCCNTGKGKKVSGEFVKCECC